MFYLLHIIIIYLFIFQRSNIHIIEFNQMFGLVIFLMISLFILSTDKVLVFYSVIVSFYKLLAVSISDIFTRLVKYAGIFCELLILFWRNIQLFFSELYSFFNF